MTTRDYQRKRPLQIFLSYFAAHKRLFALDIGCAVCIALIDLSFPLVTRQALYDFLPNEKFRVFFTVMLVAAAFYVLRAGLNYIVCYYGHTFGIRVEADIRRDLFRHLQEMSFDFYDNNRTGQLMSRLTSDLFELTELAHHGPEDLLTSTVTILGALVVMATIRWELALVVAAVIPVFLAVIFSMRRRMSRVSVGVKQKVANINSEIESSLTGIRTAKAFANEAVESARFDAANNQFKTSKREFHKAMALFNSSMEFFLTSMNVIIIALGGYMIMKSKLDYRDLITFSLYIATFVTPMRKLANFSELFANGFAGLNRFVEIMRSYRHIDQLNNAVMVEVMERCKQENVLTDFFDQYGTELIEMLFKELTREEDLEISRLDGYDAGLKDGEKSGFSKGERKAVLEIARNLKRSGIAAAVIAANTGLTEDEIEQL